MSIFLSILGFIVFILLASIKGILYFAEKTEAKENDSQKMNNN